MLDLVPQLCKIGYLCKVYLVNSFVYCKLVPSVCNIHMVMLLASQIFRNLSYNVHVSAVTYTQQQIHEHE